MAEQYSRWGRTSETFSLIVVEAEEIRMKMPKDDS